MSRAYTGKTCRVIRNDYTQHFEEHPEELQPFPMQAGRAMRDGVFHLGADETATVDTEREFMPAGQGVGAIEALVPAADLVHQFVADAEAALSRVGGYVSA